MRTIKKRDERERGRERVRNHGLRAWDRRKAQSKSKFRSQGRGGFTHGNQIAKGQRKRDEGARLFDPKVYDQGVVDEIVLEDQLDRIVVDNVKLRVNQPRFGKSTRSMQCETETKTTIARNERDKRSFIEVVGGALIPEEKKNVKGGPSTARKMNKGEWKGEVHAMEMVPLLYEKLLMEGIFWVRTRTMGSKLVLLGAKDKEELKDLVEIGRIGLDSDEDAWSRDSELGELQRGECFQIQEDVGDVDETVYRD
ncbi:hypothetical protein SLEP1_g56402 [Rubroshorea leprosula]|uniref:Uncharacterized protein n=1 Tax=Rubroshorea leprosula TaxID=152421 RepID=A0AAV5MKK0_9ROSI|nr:hypothetical protein SLEP1_g56402 [Rubroshorea leprosula]